MSENPASPSAIAEEFYRRADAGRADLPDLFTEDAEIFFPKFGIARGRTAILRLSGGLMTAVASLEHLMDELRYLEVGGTVVVEGTTRGTTHAGGSWHGGQTPGGRFCSVFELDGGLISRMYIYLDPDYTSADRDRFLWPDSVDRCW